MASQRRLIVFDCDGTLIDSQHAIVEATRRAFAALDVRPPARDAILGSIGLSLPEAMAALAPMEVAETRRRLVRAYREACVASRQEGAARELMFKGARRLLRRLARSSDVMLGIATGKSRRGLSRFIVENGLQRIFATLQCADDAPSKPHPAMLLRAMAETGTSPQATVMVGDSSHDMTMACRAGVTGIGVGWGNHSPADLRNSGARAVAGDFTELTRLLISDEMSQTPGAVAA